MLFKRHAARAALVSLLATASFVGTQTTVMPPAYANTTIVTFAGGAVLYAPCLDYDYDYSIDTTRDGAYHSWDAKAVLRGPNGKVASKDYVDGGTGPVEGAGDLLLCGRVHQAGRYELTLSVTYFDADYDEIGTFTATDTFKLRKPRTKTSFTVSDRTPTWHQFVTFRVKSRIEGPSDYMPNRYKYVALQAKRGEKWKLIPGSKERVGGRGMTTMKARWERRSPLLIRAITFKDRELQQSVTAAKRIG